MATNLITLAEYKAYEGINSTTQDTEISTIIPKVSELVKNICRRTFVDWRDDQKTEVYNGGPVLLLQEAPVIQIFGIEKSENYGQTYTSLTEFTDWVFDSENQQILSLDPTGEFKKLINGYRVSYTAGYENIPEDLKLAVLDLVTYYMKNQGSVQSQVAVTSTNAQVQYLTQTNLPTHIKRVLDLYVLNYN
jgi:hypothetical protein